MAIVKEKSSTGCILALVIIAGMILLIYMCFIPVKQVPDGTVLYLTGDKEQKVWFAPGGKYPPSGYKTKIVDTIQPDDEITIRTNQKGISTHEIGLFMKKYVRIETPSGKIGWISLSFLTP